MYRKVLLGVLLVCLNSPAQQARTGEPRYTNDGQLMRPDNYRELIYLSSGLGMTYGVIAGAAPRGYGEGHCQAGSREVVWIAASV
jgi:hypothetical protein